MDNKNIKDIRKSITKRKQEKRHRITSSKERTSFHYDIPQEEEKHGYFPFSSHQSTFGKKDQLTVPSFIFKGLLAGILFFSMAIMLRLDVDALEKPKSWLLNAVTEDFNFAKVQGWYRENLGSPFAFLNDKGNIEHVSKDGIVLPASGSISKSFQETGKGVMIEVADEENMSVTAVNAGTVIFAGNEKETGKTIIIQHEDGSNSIYGNLHEMDVFQYQFVSKNDVIGTLKPESGSNTASLYFAIKENQTYLDPVKVIQVDEQN